MMYFCLVNYSFRAHNPAPVRSVPHGRLRSPYFLLSVTVVLIAGFCAAAGATSLVFPPYGHSYGIRKATPAHLLMFFGPRTFFDEPQGLATAKMKSRDDPTTKKDDDEVVVYGVNGGRHELIYNTSMWTLSLYGGRGSGKDQFFHPRGIATEPQGHVFVADSGNNRIVHLFNPKREVQWVKAFSGKSPPDSGLRGPSQVSLGADLSVYVTDTGNRRVVRFDSSGAPRQIYPARGSPGLFENGPTTLAVADGSDRWSHYSDDRFFVCADRNGTRLWKIGFNGAVEKKVDLPSGHRAGYAAVDYYHNVWITDRQRHCILKYDRDLRLLEVFGSEGSGDNQFIEPRGIAIWKRFGQTFIAEKKGAQYYWVGTHLKSKKLGTGGDGQYTLTLDLTEYSYVSLFRASGTDTVYALRRRFFLPGGTSVVFQDMAGCMKAKGNLLLRIEPTYSSFTYVKWEFPVEPVR